MYKYLLLVSFFFLSIKVFSQIIISGKVFDSTGKVPLNSVNAFLNSGKWTSTDENGYYEIKASKSDTLWFSYLGQRTQGFPVKQIWNYLNFDISLKVSIPTLKNVNVYTKSHRLDSIENRKTYSKIFNYKRPTIASIITSFGLGVTIDLDELIRAFQVKKIRKNLKFQARLIQDEKDKYINGRFNKQLISRLTGLNGSTLDTFIKRNRPTYDFTISTTDYEFRENILKRYSEQYHSRN